MKCNFCEKGNKVEPFIPKDKNEELIFMRNKWFFAYCSCDWGTFIIEKNDINGDLKNEKRKSKS